MIETQEDFEFEFCVTTTDPSSWEATQSMNLTKILCETKEDIIDLYNDILDNKYYEIPKYPIERQWDRHMWLVEKGLAGQHKNAIVYIEPPSMNIIQYAGTI